MTNCSTCVHCKYDAGWEMYFCEKNRRLPWDTTYSEAYDPFIDPGDCEDHTTNKED